MAARLPALLPGCPAEQGAAALGVLLGAAAATGDPALVQDVTARITELGGEAGTTSTAAKRANSAPRDLGAKNPAKTVARR
jgi:hypothetical protein